MLHAHANVGLLTPLGTSQGRPHAEERGGEPRELRGVAPGLQRLGRERVCAQASPRIPRAPLRCGIRMGARPAGRSDRRVVGRAVGRGLGWMVGRSVGQSSGRTVGRSVGWAVSRLGVVAKSMFGVPSRLGEVRPDRPRISSIGFAAAVRAGSARCVSSESEPRAPISSQRAPAPNSTPAVPSPHVRDALRAGLKRVRA